MRRGRGRPVHSRALRAVAPRGGALALTPDVMLTSGEVSDPAPRPGTSTYYRYTDEGGRIHLVDQLGEVPARYRERAERISLDPSVVREEAGASSPPDPLVAPQFMLGFASALALVFAVWVARLPLNPFLKLVVSAAVATVVVLAYLGALRRQTGAQEGWFTSPAAIIDDARRNVELLNQRQRERDQVLEQLQKDPGGTSRSPER